MMNNLKRVRVAGCIVALAFLWACDGDPPAGPTGDCSENGVGCSPGFACVMSEAGGYDCVPDTNGNLDGGMQNDGQVMSPDTSIIDASPSTDATVQTDATTADGDGDGVLDGVDNCPDVSNPQQEDGDGDGAGDACDAEPTVGNFSLNGQLLTIGGRAVDETHTLGSKVTTGAVESTDGTFILQGNLSP